MTVFTRLVKFSDASTPQARNKSLVTFFLVWKTCSGTTVSENAYHDLTFTFCFEFRMISAYLFHIPSRIRINTKASRGFHVSHYSKWKVLFFHTSVTTMENTSIPPRLLDQRPFLLLY